MPVTLYPRPILKNCLTETSHWQLPALPPLLEGRSGIIPLRATLDPSIGPELVMAIFDHTTFVFDLAAIQPFELHLNTGVVRTSAGPVFFLLFWLRNPQGQQPFAMWDITLNPHDSAHMQRYWELAHQSHWHVCVLGLANEVLNMYQFENDFGLADAIRVAVEACRPVPCPDFDSAKAEYERDHSLAQLFAMGGPEDAR